MIPCIIFVYFNATCILLNSIIPCFLFNHYSDPLHTCTFYWGCQWSLNLQFAQVIPYIFCLPQWSLTFFVCPSDSLYFWFVSLQWSLTFFVWIITVISYICFMRQWSLTFFVCDSDPLHFNPPLQLSLTFFVCDSDSLYFLFAPVIPYIFVCPSDPLHVLIATVIPYISILSYSDLLHFNPPLKWSLTFQSSVTVIPYISILRYSDPLHFNPPLKWSLTFQSSVKMIPYISILRYSDPLQFTYNYFVYRGQCHSERYASAV